MESFTELKPLGMLEYLERHKVFFLLMFQDRVYVSPDVLELIYNQAGLRLTQILVPLPPKCLRLKVHAPKPGYK